jgi:hypothetical protein
MPITSLRKQELNQYMQFDLIALLPVSFNYLIEITSDDGMISNQ